MVRAKFRCDHIATVKGEHGEHDRIQFYAVTGGTEEDESFWKASPNGNLVLDCLNKKASEYFIPGKKYYLDFTEAE